MKLQEPWGKLLSNFSALSLLQAANSLVPLLILPYLYSILGIENLGKVFLTQAVTNFFVQFTDYGFSNTAVRKISQQHNSVALPEITGEFFTLRLLLFFLTSLVFALMVVIIPDVRSEYPNFLLSFLIVAGQALNPYWLLQGIEKTNYHALLNLLGKILFVLFTFLLIKNKSDYYLTNGLQGATALLTGLAGWVMIYRKHLLSFNTVSIRSVLNEMKSGFSNFISGFINFSNAGSYLILTNYFAGPVQAGYFGIAEKIFLFGRALPIVIHQSIYPYVCRVSESSFEEVRKFFRFFYSLVIPVFIAGTTFVFIFAHEVVKLITGNAVPEAVDLLKITSSIPFLAVISIPFSQLLLAKHFNQSYSNAILRGSAISFIISIVLIYRFQATGAALSALVGELIMLTSLSFQLERSHQDYSLLTKTFNV